LTKTLIKRIEQNNASLKCTIFIRICNIACCSFIIEIRYIEASSGYPSSLKGSLAVISAHPLQSVPHPAIKRSLSNF